MVRWITFDDHTAAALVKSVASGAAEIRDGDAFETALREGDCSVLLPSESPGLVLFLRVRPGIATIDIPKKPAASETQTVPTAEEPALYEAVGFLGLSDSPVYHDEEKRPKKWWRKLLD